MRVAVLGAGAIGAYVGAALARGGADVHADRPRRAPRRRCGADGVQVLSPRGDFTAHPPATDDPRDGRTASTSSFVGAQGLQPAQIAGPLLGQLLGPEAAVGRGAERHPLVVLPVAAGPHGGAGVESVDPGGAVSAAIRARAGDRLRRLLLHRDRTSPASIRHIEGTRFSIGEPDGSTSSAARRSARRWSPAGSSARSNRRSATRSGSS